MAKRGRKPKPHITSWGETIPGLYRLPDGRWRITGSDERFTQPDERLAVTHFRRLMAKRAGTDGLVSIPLPPSADPTDPDLSGAVEAVLRHELGPGVHHAPTDDTLVLRIPDDPGDPFALFRALPEPALFAYFADQLARRPQYVAQMTGIEQLGYLADLPKPTPSPTLDDLGELFQRKKIDANWLSKARTFWREFQESVGVTKLRDVTQDLVCGYEESVLEAMREGSHAPTYARQRFQMVKSIVNYPPKRGKWADDCKRVYGYCAVLVPPTKSATDPQPITCDQYRALLGAADPQTSALLLVMLNCCMYGGEAAVLEWRELDLDRGTLSTDRRKTGVVRVAVLWPRTVAALRALPRTTTGHVFSADRGNANYQTTYKAYKALRATLPDVKGVQLSHVRDGAYTAAVDAGVSLERCKLLAGHATGIADHYVKRLPTMVADACRAIDAHYFG